MAFWWLSEDRDIAGQQIEVRKLIILTPPAVAMPSCCCFNASLIRCSESSPRNIAEATQSRIIRCCTYTITDHQHTRYSSLKDCSSCKYIQSCILLAPSSLLFYTAKKRIVPLFSVAKSWQTQRVTLLYKPVMARIFRQPIGAELIVNLPLCEWRQIQWITTRIRIKSAGYRLIFFLYDLLLFCTLISLGVSVGSSSRSNLPVKPAPALSTLHIAPCVRWVLWISVSHAVVLDYSVAEISESHQPLWPPSTFTPFAECSVERQKHPKSPLFSTFRWFLCGVPVNSDAFDANRLSRCSR